MANGGIPTGGAPLFLGDFSKTAAAVGQRTTDMLSKRLAEKRQTDLRAQERSQKALLEALDFSAIEGLGRKAAMEHATALNEFSDKWVERMHERGNKLTTQDLIELNQGKTALEQDIANKKYNVAQVAKYQQMLKEKPDMWHPNSLVNLQKFIKEGNLGMDASTIMQPYFSMTPYLKDIDLEAQQIGLPEFTEDKMFYRTQESNEEAVERQIQGILQRPDIQIRMQDPFERQNILGQLNAFRQANISTGFGDYKPTTSTMLKQFEDEQMTPEQKELDKLYPGAGEAASNYHFNNEMGTRVRSLDRRGLDFVVNSDPKVQSWKVMPDKKVHFYSVPVDQVTDPEKQTVYSLDYIPDTGNETKDRMMIAETYNTLNLDVMTGKQVDKGMTKHFKRVDPGDMEPVGVTDYEEIKTQFADPNIDEDVIVERFNLMLDEAGYDSEKHGIKKAALKWGDNKIATKKGIGPGVGGTIYFDLNTEDGKKKLDKYMRDIVTELSDQSAYGETATEDKGDAGKGDTGGETRDLLSNNLGRGQVGTKMEFTPEADTTKQWEGTRPPGATETADEDPRITAERDKVLTGYDSYEAIQKAYKDAELSDEKFEKDMKALGITKGSEFGKKKVDEIKGTMKVVDAKDVSSPTFEAFKEKIGDPKYSQPKRFDEGFEDCSSAVCKVLNIPNKKGAAVSAEDIYNGPYTEDKKAITDIDKFVTDAVDGDLVFMNADTGNDKNKKQGIDHIAFVAVDEKTGNKYIVEVASGKKRGGSYITNLEERMNELKGSKFWTAKPTDKTALANK